MCGDGMLDPMEGEECDDGNQDTTDSCVGEYSSNFVSLFSLFITNNKPTDPQQRYQSALPLKSQWRTIALHCVSTSFCLIYFDFQAVEGLSVGMVTYT